MTHDNEEFIRQIAWEKWVDPYGENLDDVEWPGAFGTFETDDMIEKMERMEAGEIDEDDEDEEEWNEDEYDQLDGKPLPRVQRRPRKPMKILATPVGLVPMTEWTTPSKIFNFWVAHANFRMTQKVQDILDTTDGVETLDIYTPYRWRVGIGKAFNSQVVKQRIMQNLSAQPLKLTEPGET